MNIATTVNQNQLLEVLLNVSVVRPVFIWGAPGIGKSSIVENFSESLGLPCVSLLGSQLAPEDIIGVPQIIDGKSVFCLPRMIAREEPYCLFFDELNASLQEVQKAFYSLIHDRRIGEYHLPKGSIIIGAGNRAQDNAIVKPMSSALLTACFMWSSSLRIATGSTGQPKTAYILSFWNISGCGRIISGGSRQKPRNRFLLRVLGICCRMHCTAMVTI